MRPPSLRSPGLYRLTPGYDARVEHRFTGPSYTLGIEEELMIVDQETLDLTSSIEGLLEALGDIDKDGEVKPELMESVCEIATEPCPDTREAGFQLRALRRLVQQVAGDRGAAIGAAGTPPLPPRYDDFEDWSRRIEFMTTAKVIRDYTYLWYDVRPHPNFGTVEIRAMDSQTRVEHTLAIAALIQAMVKELAEHYEADKQLSRYPYEMLDENKWLAARHGLDAQLVDLPKQERVPVPELARRVMERLRPHAEELGSEADFDCLEYILELGNGASRQRKVYEANHDLREVIR